MHLEVSMSKSKKPAKPSRRPAEPATRDIDHLFARSRALAPAIIEHSGVFNASSDEWFDALTALGTPVEDRFHALYDKHDAEVEHAISEVACEAREVGYALGLAVGLQLAKGQIGGAR
jgi:hypothetical protein